MIHILIFKGTADSMKFLFGMILSRFAMRIEINILHQLIFLKY